MRTARTIPDDRAGTPSEPIAVVGLACRFPGADRPAAFWDLLRDGGSALAPPAPERRLAARPGGFLDDVAGFDPEFFDISPREAAAMDPQQRLALELGWEAFEDAGIVAGDLRGRRAGVFVGAMWDDYATLLHRAGPAAATQHSMTGLHRGAIANRVSYTFDLRGPSMVIDTGQSSSLVAVHTACESLRRGESVLALAGGVSLMLAPESTVYSEKFGALSPDGQCFTLDARANGYVRGEGAGFLVLKPLSAALADHDRVYCVIEAGAVNSGGASEGLTVPRAGAQEAVLREAYGRAGVDPADVQYVELHGTGTRKGDPVEAAALGAVFGGGSGGRPPLYVGSVKTNIGHLEAAAGVAGLIKTVLSIRHRRIPPSRNFSEPHPDIPLDAWHLRVPTEPAPWPREDAPLLAGVSSFGMGGTNCHVVLSDRHPVAPADEAAAGGAVMYDGAAEAAATGEDAAEAAAGEGAEAEAAGREAQEAVPGAAAPVPWVVTARSPGALRAQAARLREHVAARPGLGAEAVGYTLSAHRTAHEERAVVLGRTPEDHLAGLDALARGVPAAGLVRGTARDGGRTAFLFSGQGSQRPRMGYELHASLPEFAAALDEVCTAFDPHLPHRLKDLLFAGPGTAEAALLDETEYTQAALFAVESALYRLLRASGVEPDYLLGHSIGELTAAYASGVLGLADACALVAARGRLMQRATAGGAMAAVEAGEEEVGAVLAAHGDRVSIAALNGPRTTVVSGDRAAVAEVTAHFRTAGRRTKELRVSHAFHSAHMDGALEEFRAVAAGLTYGTPKIPVVSNVTGRLATAAELASADYWTRHIRACVRYADGVRLLHAEGVTGYWELGPGGLAAMTRESLADAGTAPGGVVVPVLRDGRPEELTVATALAEAYVRGAAVDWGVLTGWTPARVELPTYAFQRRPFWFEEPGGRAREDTAAAAGSATGETVGSATGHADGTAPGHTAGTATGPVTVAAPEPRPAPESAPGPAREPGAEPLELVRTCVATVLGYLSTDTVDTRRTFKELGFDSLTAVEFRDRVAEATGLTGLPPTLIYNFPTPAGLAGFLQSRLSGEQSAAEAPAAAVPARHDEPIAIVGMSCRFPGGVRSPEDLWRLVADGRTGLSAFPDDREWPDVELRDPENPDVRYARTGGFLHDAAAFDAPFFGISPREALAMDPQQRLVLETSWEALERAGIDPGGLRGRQVGVFTGATAQDYGPRLGDPDHGTHGYLLTGSTPSVVSGRVAYALGLEGPALTVDTACSSSLAALHLAARSLSAGECALALAGGVTVMATPGMFVEFAQQRGLAPDGRCKPFARAADGTGWSEGVGMVVLERLSDARRQGHRVLAVLRGSAVNQDGASNGLTAPNGPSQERVIRQALADAGLAAGDVDVVEAHGTGTKLGDPIEAQALLATYGQGRDTGRPLRLGSVKSNIGHTQAAAGVAAVIKMVMALRHDSLPASLNIDEPTPYVDWSAGAVELLTEPLPWPRGERTRRAGVSSFGISGTNVHAILEEAPAEDGPAAPDPAAGPPPAVVPWPLSARSPEALRGQAAALRSYLADRPGLSPVDVGHSLATTRAALEHRAVVVGGSREELTAGLDALLAGDTADAVVRAVAAADAERVFVFPGQGAQWARMAVELLDTAPVFAARMRECAAALDAVTDWSLLDVLRGEPGAPTLERVDVVQPVLFAMMVSLARLWESYGVRPTAVVGHSQGEIAAACVAGALSLADAARIVALRSRALVALSGRGGMVSVALPDAEARRLPCWDGRLDVAVVNGPSSVVVSGEPAALDELLAVCAERGVRAKRIPVSYAAHSAQVEAIQEELMEALREVTPRAAGIPFYSTVTGDVLDTTTLDAAYWYRNLRETVRFERTMGTVLAKGHTLVLEISPHPVLRGDIEEAIASRGARGAVVGSLRRDDGGLRRFVTSVAEAHAHGAPVDWSGVFAGTGAARVELPTYAFQHERYWLAPPAPAAAPGGADETHSAFWDIVARGDADGLAAELALPDEAALRAVLPALSAWHERQRAAASADSWRYRITWRPAPHTPAGSPAGGWLVLLDPATRESPLAAAVLGALGDSARVVPVDHYGADGGADGLAAVLRSLPAGGPEPSGVLLLAPPTPLGATVPSRSGDWPGLLGVLRALGEAGVTAPLWCVTQGAVAVGGEELAAPVQAQLWGLGRVAAVEFPQRWGGLVDLPADLDPAAAGPLAAVLADPGGESQVALRTEGVFVRRLVRAPRQTRPGGDEPRFGGTVLVTGGTGALGRHTAAWLADRGAEHLVLVSRSGPAAPGADALQALLSERGVRVSTLACDVSDRAALAALLDGLDAAGDRIRAVVHTAGVIENTPLGELTPERFAEVLRAKADAALHLHDLTRDRELDAFVLFSSVSGMWGSTGNGGYAAANAFLDALALHRRGLGLPATSVIWGPWDGDGMMTRGGMAQAVVRRGLRLLAPEPATAALGRCLLGDDPTPVVADVDWEALAGAFGATRTTALFADLPEARAALGEARPAAEEPTQTLAGRLAPLSPLQRRETVSLIVRTQVARVLGYAGPDAVSEEKPFKDLGVDSVISVELRNRLQADTGLRLPVTVVFDHPTVAQLADLLLAAAGTGDDSASDDASGAGDDASVSRDAPGSDRERDRTRRIQHAQERINDMDADDLVRLALGER